MWSTYFPIILEYGLTTTNKKVHDLLDSVDFSLKSDDEKQVYSLKTLFYLFYPKKTENVLYVYEEYPVDTPIQTALMQTPKRNSPRIGVFQTQESFQYFIFVEQVVLYEVSDMCSALYSWFAVFYVFNLEYHKNSKCIGWFFQDVILGIPDSTRRAASYISVVSDIKARVSHEIC